MTYLSKAPEAAGEASAKAASSSRPNDLKNRLREAEESLTQCQEMLRLALSVAKLGSWERDIKTGVMTCSPAYLANLGLAPDTPMTFTRLQQIRHPDDAALVDRTIAEAIAQKSDYDVSYRVTRSDGSIGRVMARGRAIYENGEAVRMIGVTMDMTEQGYAREIMQDVQRRQEFLLGLNDRLRDLEDPLAIMSNATASLSRFLNADRIGYGWIGAHGELIGWESRKDRSQGTAISYALQSFGAALVDQLQAGQIVIVKDIATDPVIDPDAKAFYDKLEAQTVILIPLVKAEHLDALLYIASRHPGRLLQETGLAEDVAERTWDAVERAQAVIRVRESQTRMRIIAETLPALVWIINSNLELLYANARWATFSGLSEEDSLGHSWMKVMHPDDVARVVKDIDIWRKDESPFTVELRYRTLDGVYRWHLVRAEPLHDSHGKFQGWSGTSIDIHDLKETEEALRRNGTQLRLALQAAHMGVWSWDAKTDSVTISDRAAEIFSVEPAPNMTWSTLLNRLDRRDLPQISAATERSIASGELYNVEFRLVSGEIAPQSWVASQGQVTYSPDGTVLGMTGVVQDITDRKEAEERQSLLIRELHHRVKNTLATVQAIVGSTARTASSIEDFYQAFVGRIVSLARTHNLLTEDLWQKASLSDLVNNELGPYDNEHRNRIIIEGYDIELPSEAAVPIGMAIHELTTNAAKHGALSTFGGQVEVHWKLTRQDDKPILNFSWEERGGPPVAVPTRQGFGSRLLQRVLSTQLQADVHMDFAPEGLHFTMTMPIPGDPPLFNPDR